MQRQGRRPPESGQTTAEYALILGGIAVACIVALVWLAQPIDRLFHDPVNLPSEQPFAPPVGPGQPNEPTSLADCANGGWLTYGFAHEADCEAFVTDGGSP